MEFKAMIPVLPTADMVRDAKWYEEKTGFVPVFGDKMYAGLRRDNMSLHLQWHADTEDDPLLGGSVVKIFVDDVQALFQEFVERGTVGEDKLQLNTPWGTHEFGFYDLNKNAIFFVQDV
ncbi:MAG: hypothetical protein Roseis2KO_45610 [Roseivirga sp.]